MAASSDNRLPRIKFRGKLRPSQKDAVRVIKAQLKAGARRLHIVAPPGAGKTVLGLYAWAELVRRPAVVLSPNSAIQSQWVARLELFDVARHDHVISTEAAAPGVFNSLTYQSITLPRRGGGAIDEAALDRWRQRLLQREQAEDIDEAGAWIDDLRQNNPAYYDERLAVYRKDVRDELARSGESLATLHASAAKALEALRERGIGLVILDECHHLLGHWGRVLNDAHDLLEEPVVLGLTATPPDVRGKDPQDVKRYDAFFGPVDFEVPVPALVKEGHLAPYQDLAHFVRPGAEELQFIAQADGQFREIVEELCTSADREESDRAAPMPQWVYSALVERRLPTGSAKDWRAYHRRDPAFGDMARLFLLSRGFRLAPDIPPAPRELIEQEVPELEMLVPVLDRYIRHGLRRSSSRADHALAERVIERLRMLGLQVTETGTQPCASPVSRVLAYASGKAEAAAAILNAERAVLGERIRAVVVTDYEKTSAVSAATADVLSRESGGAIAVFRQLIADEGTDALDPVLVTGSTVLVDEDLRERFMDEARQWLAEHKRETELSAEARDGFAIIVGRGSDWCPRIYVRMITELFQRGVTRCLVGTRGLLGEGWDAHTVNVLIDLTTVTTSMTVNQLRGRSIRLDPDAPKKVADNWDVICLAGEFAKGLDDYQRFMAKHETLYGVTDDGAIEKGVGHVHAAFTALKPELVEGSVGLLNAEMLSRAARRTECRALWRIGEPFRGDPVTTIELAPRDGSAPMGFPPFSKRRDIWTNHSLALAIGRCVLDALREAELVDAAPGLQSTERSGGYVRLFLNGAKPADGELFIRSVHEAMGTLDRPRYVIPRAVDVYDDTWLSRIMPGLLARFLRKRRRKQAMLHAVPAALAKNKQLVETYQRWWNKHVSPGEAVYALHGAGEELVERARREGWSPRMQIHEKDVFL